MSKKNSLTENEHSPLPGANGGNSGKQKYFSFAWIFYHGAILLAFLISLFFTKGIKIDADFYNMMPSGQESKAVKIAEKSIFKNSNNSVFMLASHEDFSKAKKAAEEAYGILSRNEKFASLTLYQDFSSSQDILAFLDKYKYQLLSPEMRGKLSAPGGAAEYSEESLAKIFGGFTLTALDNLGSDPFLLNDSNLENYLSAISDAGTSLQPKDGVLASKFDGKWYVMLRGELTAQGAKLASDENAVPDIYDACFPLEKDGVRFVFYGTTFHSYKSSVSANHEISVISTVSMLAVLVILLVVFHSGLPIVCSLASILVSLAAAFCATHLVFGNLHAMTLVFGTSLIGSSIDYSLHFFVNWKANRIFDSGEKIRRHIFEGLILSLISTEICYALLFFAPFTMLKQMALFSFAGILSSFLTATGLFPLFPLPAEQKRTIPVFEKFFAGTGAKHHKSIRTLKIVFQISVFFACILIIAFNHKNVKIENNISNLYKMEGRLKDDTVLAYQVLNYNPTSWLIICGNSAEEVLQKEEQIAPEIPDPFVCVSRFIPSEKSQDESLAAAENLVPLAKEQLEFLGFDESSIAKFSDDFKRQLEQKNYLSPESEVPEALKSLLNMLWIGEIDGKYYSVLLPSKISDENFYLDLAENDGNIFFENKVKDVSASLDNLTELIAAMFAIAFVVIIVLMKFFYSWRETLKIASIPVLSVLVILSVFTLAGLKIEFFCITGIILVFGLGLDYIIYKLENKSNNLETFAIVLSFVTTAISFGALALSSFVPVHVLGLAIFSGLTAAFVFALL